MLPSFDGMPWKLRDCDRVYRAGAPVEIVTQTYLLWQLQTCESADTG